MNAALQNASQPARMFYCRHMQPGTVRYNEGGKDETILVDTDAIKKMIPSGVGIPVYVQHIDGEVELDTLKEKAAGFVVESFYNELDGWAWFKFLAVDDIAHTAIKKGWSVSNAHKPSKWGGPGTKNNVPYRREVLDSIYTHLAIVPDPRYEGALNMSPDEFKNYQEDNRKKLAELQNSKEKPMYKLFKTKKEEVTGSAVDLDTSVDLENGKSLTIKEMIEAVLENSKKSDAKVKVGDKEMTVEELVNAYSKMNKKTKKNGSSEEETPSGENEEVEGDQEEEGDDEIGTDKKNKKTKKNRKMKKNSECDDDSMSNSEDDDEEEVEEKNKKSKKNSKGSDTEEVEVDDRYFKELQNASMNPQRRSTEPMVVTSIDGIERGKQRYGSGK